MRHCVVMGEFVVLEFFCLTELKQCFYYFSFSCAVDEEYTGDPVMALSAFMSLCITFGLL